MIRRLLPFALALGLLPLTAPRPALALPPICNGTIYGDDGNNVLYTFDPSVSPTLTQLAPVTGVANYGGNGATIARGTKSGDLFLIPLIANAPVYALSTSPYTGAATQVVANIGNANAVTYAFGFDNTGRGYAISSTESFSFLDNGQGTTTVQTSSAPVIAGGGNLATFNSGDLAFDQSGQGYTILTTRGQAQSPFLYKITFTGTTTTLTLVAQVTLNGAPYPLGDLYDFAFGTGNRGYVTAGTTTTLYQINTATGALTTPPGGGAQSANLVDLGSCPFFPIPNPSILKTGPTAAAVGDLIQYTIRTANDPAASSPGVNVVLADTIPTGITILSATCAGTGVACPTPTVNGQNITDTIPSLPAGASATITVYAKDTSLAVGAAIKNTATFTADNASNDLSSTTLTTAGNTVTKTVANITQGSAATPTTDVGKPHDVLQYALSYGNVTGGPLSKFALSDVIPTNTTYVAASATCPTVPTGFTCAITQPTAANGQTVTFTYSPTAAGNTIPFETAVPAPAQVGATFQVTIN